MNDALDRLARAYPAGTVLFEEGQPGDDMYIIVSGEIELRRQVGDTERVLAILPPGEFFGEMAILNGRPRSATAVARTHTQVVVIDATTFEAMLRARPEIALRIIRSLSSRLDAANHHVELLLLPTADHRVVQCLRRMAEEQIQRAGIAMSHGTAILVPATASDIAARVGLPLEEVSDVIDRLRTAQLVMTMRDNGIDGEGYVVPEVGRLLEFLEFLTLKARFKADP